MVLLRHLFTSVLIISSLDFLYGSSCCAKTMPCQVWRKLNGLDPVCFKASDGGHTEFQSKFGINMWKLKYVRRNGYHECQDGHGGYFGCEEYPYRDGHKSHHIHVHHHSSYANYAYDTMQDDMPQSDEPQNDEPQKDQPQADSSTQGPGQLHLQQISVYLTDTNSNVLMPQEPFHKPYFTEPSINRPAWDNSLTLSVCDGPLEIMYNQAMRLYHGEDLFDMNTDDNSGELCVDVYAYGEIVD